MSASSHSISPKGVQIQEGKNIQLPLPLNNVDDVTAEVLNELHRSQESGYNMRDGVRQNHLNRAKICSKIIKYPHLEDYAVRALLFVLKYGSSSWLQLALKEHDDKQLYIARQNLSDLRNVYAIMTDILHKNISKVILVPFATMLLLLNLIHRFVHRKLIMAWAYINPLSWYILVISYWTSLAIHDI